MAIGRVYRDVAWLEREGVQVVSNFHDRYGLFPWQRKQRWQALFEWTFATPDDVVVTYSTREKVHPIVERLATLTTIRRLNLAGSEIGSADLDLLSQLPDLEHLLVGGTMIDDGAMRSANAFSNLKVLDLSETRISDASLSQIAQMESLEWVNLYKTRVSDQGLRQLRRERPKLTIIPPRRQRSPRMVAVNAYAPPHVREASKSG
jgi:hypothetical protein